MLKRKILPLLVGLLILTGSILACGGSSDANTGTTSASASGKSTQTPTKHFKTGDVVKVGDTWEITVNSVQALTQDGDFNKPKDGQVFLAIDLTTKDVSNKEQNISSLLNFSLKGADGTKYNQTVLTSLPPAPDGKVEANDQLKGNLAYEVPADQKTFVLSFQADIISSGQTQWDLSL